jgi:SAM-dependent methyltransferase
MKPRLLEWLRCTGCGQRFAPVPDASLRCVGCGVRIEVRDGVPRFAHDDTSTAEYFGYIWGLQAASVRVPTAQRPYHLRVMTDAVGVPMPEGLVLDGGCGDGVDLAMLALDPNVEIVGVELSGGGVATTSARTRGLERAHVIQADLLRIPLASDTFDAAYSYGVVHHTPDPAKAVREIARTLKPGAPLLLYVYEDFGDRAWYWRLALNVANSARTVTTRMPPRALMAVCKALSPVVYVCCTLPSRHFRWARRFPYRHGTHPWSMTGDLYDRLSAPIEVRYSESGAARLAAQAGLDVKRVEQRRGWVVYAVKPA